MKVTQGSGFQIRITQQQIQKMKSFSDFLMGSEEGVGEKDQTPKISRHNLFNKNSATAQRITKKPSQLQLDDK